ncbi:hypothetical protein [Rothia sp. CCM 9418]
MDEPSSYRHRYMTDVFTLEYNTMSDQYFKAHHLALLSQSARAMKPVVR